MTSSLKTQMTRELKRNDYIFLSIGSIGLGMNQVSFKRELVFPSDMMVSFLLPFFRLIKK